MSVLEDLYSGKIYPLENIVSHNPAYRPTNEKIGDMRSYFLKSCCRKIEKNLRNGTSFSMNQIAWTLMLISPMDFD